MRDELDDILQQLQVKLETKPDSHGVVLFTVSVKGVNYERHPAVSEIHEALSREKDWEDVAGRYPHFLVLIMFLKSMVNGFPIYNLKFENQIITFEI